MGPFVFAATGVFFCSIVAGGVVLFLRPQSSRNRSFFVLALVVSLWNLITVFIYSTTSPAAAQRWLRIGMAFCVVTVPTLLLYAGTVSEGQRTLIVATVAYAASIPFLYRSVTTGLVFEVGHSARGLWLFRVGAFYPWVVAWVLYLTIVVSYAVYLLIRPRINGAVNIDRQANRSLSIAIAVWFVVGMVFDFVVAPRLGVPAIAPLLFVLLIVQTAVSIVRRHFMADTPGLLSRCLINNLEEGLALVDSQAQLLVANIQSEDVLGSPTTAHGRKSYPWLLAPGGELSSGFAAVAAGRRKRFVTTTDIPGNSEGLVCLDLSPVRDGACGIMGVLIQCRKVPDLSRLLRQLHITRREWQVVTHVAAGESYRFIAKDLGITVRTVKAHVTNVYGKVRVKNRVELLNKLSDAGVARPHPVPSGTGSLYRSTP